jgi:hypothetical protein
MRIKERPLVVRERSDGWIDLVEQDTGRAILSVKPPEGGFTVEEVERFRTHLLQLVAEKPS